MPVTTRCARCGEWCDDDSFPCVANVGEHSLEKDANPQRVCCECLKTGDVVLERSKCDE